MSKKKNMVFAVGPGNNDETFIMLGVSKAAWDHMKEGMTHTFDLTEVIGQPIKIIVFGAKTQAQCIQVIQQHNESLGNATLIDKESDFSIKPKKPH